MRRILTITLGLLATGSAVGAVLGALSLWVATAALGVGPINSNAELLVAGAQAGALTGAALAPVSAWALMRHAPLWRAVIEPAIATALGSLGGSTAAALLGGGLAWSILGAPIGFFAAAVHLKLRYSSERSADARVAAS